MHRICTCLAENGYTVTLIGRRLPTSIPLENKKFRQKRLNLFFTKGKLFYAEYNVRLFLYLLFQKIDAICAIDLDTIIPCYYISTIKKTARVYDAHELFTEQKEIITRPTIHHWWKKIEQRYVPRFSHGYTVCESIAQFFQQRYKVHYSIIRNLPILETDSQPITASKPFILYQGAVNEARGLEALIPAMVHIPYPLIICGDGNFMPQLKKLITVYGVTEKVILKGMVPPSELKKISSQALIGVNLIENTGLNQYFSLANKFFDYIHAGIPQVTMNYPEYKKINDELTVGVLIDALTTEKISYAVNNLAKDTVTYQLMKDNCSKQKLKYNWQQEQLHLITFYDALFNK
jgi:glycosyltransferase involved in cell wall biosynthesis